MNQIQIKNIPETHGIYIFKDEKGKILYVGKAKSLRARVMSYFQNFSRHGSRIGAMVSKVSDIDTVVTKTEIEALILESNFIKKYRPRYNIILKDDKHYPYLRFSIDEDFPKLTVVRRVERDKAVYFGPYIPTNVMRGMLRQLYKIFPLRQSRDVLDGVPKRRPCLNYQMGRCLAPCAGYVTKEEYAKIVKGVMLFLKGRNNDLIEYLSQQMKMSADKLQFENAAIFRDKIRAIKNIVQRQEIISTSLEEQDVISYYKHKEDIYIQIMFIRSGKIIGKREYNLKNQNMPHKDIIYSFLKQYYGNGEYIPDEIITKDKVDEQKLVEQWLTAMKGSAVILTSPQRGRKLSLIKLAEENAKLSFKRDTGTKNDILNQLRDLLCLSRFPEYIEAFDISNISGKMAVGSMVVFRGAKPSRAEYRRYRIKSIAGIDDYKMMSEIIYRRYSRLKKEDRQFPDLVVIDGGKGHLSAAGNVLKELNINDVNMIGIAKGKDRNDIETDEVFVKESNVPVIFDNSNFSVKLLLQQIRDEAHRFAIGYHRKLRGKEVMSALDSIEGIGKRLRISLLKHFGSAAKIKEANLKEIVKVSGISEKKARVIYQYFHNSKVE